MYIVESGSMVPALKVGSLIFVDTNNKAPDVGDVMTYKIGENGMEKLVTHRVIAIENGEFVTKGDANDYEDFAPIPKENVVGKCEYSIPKLGFLIDAFQRNKYTVFLGAGLIVLWVISFFMVEELKRQ